MRALPGLMLLVACGRQAPPAASPPKALPPATADCQDVGVILRGEVEGDDAEAGPAREQVVATACAQDRWSQQIIDCVASTPKPHGCLVQLDDAQRASLDERLQQWHDDHAAPDEGDVAHAHAHGAECSEVLVDVARWNPPMVDEREWQTKLRRDFLLDECDHGWSNELRACLQAAPDGASIDTCLASELDPGERTEVEKTLAEQARLAKQVAAAKKTPATITCKKAVAGHYGDARWKQKLDGFSAADRKKMIASSRALMLKACGAESWDDTLRACLVAAGGETCFATYGMRLRWGYPAAGTVGTTGIAECDTYAAAVDRITKCDKLPKTSRDALASAQQQLLAQIVGMPANKRTQMATSCTAGLESIESVIKSAGC